MSAPVTDCAGRIRLALDRLAGDLPALGLAVSGGGDSMALMQVAAQWAGGRRIMVATVDHGLRTESAAEARRVRDEARRLGLSHCTLLWQRREDKGNLMARARQARVLLLSEWANRHELPAVALGHTRDDQAETLVMRLARGSGIDGLSGMPERRRAHGMTWLRPLLGLTRHELRDWLQAQNVGWIDDPTNEDDRFDRIRIRKAMAAFGVDVAALARSAENIRAARDALSYFAGLAAEGVEARNATLTLPRRPFREAPAEIGRRLLIAGCRWITGAPYPPRRANVQHALAAISAGSRVTLDGALIEPWGDQLRFLREPAAAARAPASCGPEWDQRWQITGLKPGQYVAALGTAALVRLAWRASGLTRDEAAASPAIWQGDRLIAAPLLRASSHYRVAPLRNAADFRSLVICD